MALYNNDNAKGYNSQDRWNLPIVEGSDAKDISPIGQTYKISMFCVRN